MVVIRNQNISSKYFLAPINTGFSFQGEPSDRLIEFHHHRSGHFIGISYIGNVAIDKKYKTNENTLVMGNSSNWKTLIKRIKNNGSRCGIQFGCNYSPYTGIKKWKNKNFQEYVNEVQAFVKNLEKAEIELICDNFINSAKIAIDLGVDIIQIHAAHGYFLSSLLSPTLNLRNDSYSYDNVEVIVKIVEGIRKYSNSSILDIRLSLIEGVKNIQHEIEGKSKVINQITNLDVDILSLSNGLYNVNKKLIYPTKPMGHLFVYKYCKSLIQEYPAKYWSLSGNIWSMPLLQDVYPQNVVFGLGRALIADPLFVEKYFRDKKNEVIDCTRCYNCHYYSRGLNHITCPSSASFLG